ncbi:MAG TPA: glycosyltransferase family 87 protein [Flavobacteriales bacterium]|nr:glycosyltransferase family 87 protein [Flavobacteriales bacterium]
MHRSLRLFIIVAALLLLATLVLEHVNGRFWLNDFRVYYMAADAMRHGQPIYGVAFGEDTGLYKYAPAVLYFFLPYTWLPFEVAAVVHFLIIGAELILVFVLLEFVLSRYIVGNWMVRASSRALLGLLCIVVLLSRELHLGNINIGLVLLVVLATERSLAGKSWQAAFFLGLAWLVKPYLLLLAVPLAVRREFRVLFQAGVVLAVGILLPVLFDGPGGWWALQQEWVHTMLGHSVILGSPDTFTAWTTQYVLGGYPAPRGTDLFFIGCAALLLMGWTLAHVQDPGPERRQRLDRAVELWAAFALVPDLVVTDQEHFIFSLPLILFVLAYLFTHRDRLALGWFIVAMCLYATRSTDLWGSPIENKLVGWGVLGLGNFLLIGCAVLVHGRWRSTWGASVSLPTPVAG